MPILEGDIKIMASQVLADVPEGGGAATGSQIQDGVSNNLFPDVSELDRVYGRAALRKVFANVVTDSRDVYMGAHAIVADEPDDPAVSCLLFSTSDAFDTREQAQNRVESYLIQGPAYAGQLFGDHIQGQMVVSLVQRENQALPIVGQTLLLRKNEGTGSQVEQYVRAIDVASAPRTFTDSQGEYTRLVVTVSVSDQLKADFPGFPASRLDTGLNYTGKTKVYETNVADAARYFGVKPLTAAVAANSRVLQADGIFVPLVPSSREEIGVADARMNQSTAALVVGSAGTVSRSALTLFTTASPVFVGGGIMPGTLSVSGGAVTLSDKGGVLLNGTTPVGTVDYGSGVLALGANVFGGSAVGLTVSYRPSAPAVLATESIGLQVTEATRRLTWIATLNPAPTPGSLTVSYRAQGRWYTLTDDGSGAVRGPDASTGAGALNPDTSTVSLTLGALPDVPSSIILTWAPRTVAPAVLPVAPGGSAGSPAAFAEWNVGEEIVPGSVSISWGGSVQATDVAASGNLLGGASGTVSYGNGTIRATPNSLPAKGTAVTIDYTKGVKTSGSLGGFVDAGTNYTSPGTGGVVGKTFSMFVSSERPRRVHPGVDQATASPMWVTDNGSGGLTANGQVVGTINYGTGAFTLAKTFTASQNDDVFARVSMRGDGQEPFHHVVTGRETRSVTVTILNTAATLSYVSGSGGSRSSTQAFDSLHVEAALDAGRDLQAPSFTMGTTRYSGSGAALTATPGLAASESGAGGTVAGPRASVTSWAPGTSPGIASYAASQSPSEGNMVDAVTFRTASAPVAPSGFSVVVGGVVTNANAQGQIIGANVFGTIDYETGVVELAFGTATTGTDPTRSDWSHLGLPGVQWVRLAPVAAADLRYNAVAYSYLPLEADKLGLDPVRLPSDGRVPVFRRGSVVVVHHTADTAPLTVTNGQTVNLGRVNVATVRVIGDNGQTISSGYTLDRAAGTVTFTSVAGYSQPVTIRHRIEEAALLADAQISGLLRINRPLSRAYPLGSKVSSALLVGDMFARVSTLFDQATWNSSSPVWSDDLQGSAAGPTFDTINYPAQVQNRGAVTERWALVFTGSTAFVVVGEHLGQIGTGNTATDCAPLNPATGTPYFTLDRRGFNSGWSPGNVVRLNTVGASAPLWVVRVVQQGQATLQSDSFTMAVRGDIDTP